MFNFVRIFLLILFIYFLSLAGIAVFNNSAQAASSQGIVPSHQASEQSQAESSCLSRGTDAVVLAAAYANGFPKDYFVITQTAPPLSEETMTALRRILAEAWTNRDDPESYGARVYEECTGKR